MEEVDSQSINEILQLLQLQHPNASCELNYTSNFELLVAVILSAQCTDKRVNKVTAKLFKLYNTPQQLACLEQTELEKLIFECGFYHNKAKNLIAMSCDIVDKFGGSVPNDFLALQTLDGVGRKTANVMMAEAFGGQAIAVDTHVGRVANRLGIAKSDNPLIVEKALMKIIPYDLWSKTHHLLIFHGRYICKSRKPDCQNCLVKEFCKMYNSENKEMEML